MPEVGRLLSSAKIEHFAGAESEKRLASWHGCSFSGHSLGAGDRYGDETGEWEVVGRPVSFLGGKEPASEARMRWRRTSGSRWGGVSDSVARTRTKVGAFRPQHAPCLDHRYSVI